MKIIAVATAALICFSACAEAKSCSSAKASCISINKKDNQGSDGAARCQQYFQACLQTGTWTSRQGTFTGYTKN
jgi:hypothetical protein